MNAQLSLLVQLQQFDQKIHQLEDQRKKIPALIDEARLPLDQAQARLEEINAAIQKASAERRSGEQDLEEQESHVQKLRARLMELKTNKEYQAHLFEIDLANKKKDSIEERVLIAMEEVEAKQKELENVQKLVEEATQTFHHVKAELEKKAKALDQELEEVKAQRELVLPLLDKPLHQRYATLKTTLKVKVVAPVRDSSCGGCQLQVPPQLIAEVKRGDQILSCPYCHRILYAENSIGEIPALSHAQEIGES